MLRSVSLFAVLVPVGLALYACTPDTKSTDDTGVSGDDTGASSDDTGGGDGTVQSTTIYDIQTGAVAEGSDVELKGLIVTSPVTPDGDGFFVQDAGGGEYSGMYIYMQSGLTDLYIGEGDEIDLIGYTTEYYDWTEVTVTAEANIQVVGEGDITVDVVDPSSVSDWEVWESCLISTGAVTVESVDSYGEALIDGGLEINDLFFELDTEAGATYTDVIGAISYEYSEWKLNPRSEDDLSGYSSGPEAPPPPSTTCRPARSPRASPSRSRTSWSPPRWRRTASTSRTRAAARTPASTSTSTAAPRASASARGTPSPSRARPPSTTA